MPNPSHTIADPAPPTAAATPMRSNNAGTPSSARVTSTRNQAAEQPYTAEVVPHWAHQSRDDHWVAAAYDRLHETVEAYLAGLPPPRSAVVPKTVRNHHRLACALQRGA